MDFADQLRVLAGRVAERKDSVQTEEATKNAFIMPFIQQVLGYDVFDPSEVVPEFGNFGVKMASSTQQKTSSKWLLAFCAR